MSLIYTSVICTAPPGPLCILHNKIVADVRSKAALLIKVRTAFWLKVHIDPHGNHLCLVPGFHLLLLSTSRC